jgi:hypothetical protein
MGTRAQAIDVARGAALVAMIVYHACWFATDASLVTLDLHALGWHLVPAIDRRVVLPARRREPRARSPAGSEGRGPHRADRGVRASRHGHERRPRSACASCRSASSTTSPCRVSSRCPCSGSACGTPARHGARRARHGRLDPRPSPPRLDRARRRAAPTFDFQPLLPGSASSSGAPRSGRVARSGRAGSRLAFRVGVARGSAFLGRHSLLVYMAPRPLLFGITWSLAKLR